MSTVINHFYEFGEFRLDVSRRLLLRDEEVVPLVPKVFDTLWVLVRNQGRVVEKEELLREVWDGAAVEEVGLAKNISALRKALGESPAQHKFIATVPGRGYQFVAAVKVASPESQVFEEAAVEPQVSSPGRPEPATSDTVASPAAVARPKRGWRWALIVVSAGVVVSGILVYLSLRSHSVGSKADAILLADFVNQTGDPVFDLTLKQGLAVQLEQSPMLTIFPDERVRETLQRMRRSPEERLTPELGREICQRQGIKALVTGWIAPLGSHYAITLEADDSQGETLGRVQKEAPGKEHILQALSQAASELRGKLGESVRSIHKFDALLEYTTSSLDALRAYSLGYRERLRGHYLQAISFYQQAVQLDPNFAFAYVAMANAYRNTRQPARAAECTAKAYALQAHVSERERLSILAQYYIQITGEIDKRIEVLKLLSQSYPGDAAPHTNLATTYELLGEFDRALEESQTSLRINPDSAIRHSVLGNVLMHMNRFAEAKTVYEQSEARWDSTSIHTGLFRIAFMNGDGAGMERQIKWANEHSNDYAALEWQAGVAAALGQWKKSGDFSRLSVEAVKGTEAKEVGAEYAAQAALRAALLDRCPDVKPEVNAALAIERNENSLTRSAVALAWCGETKETADLVDDLRRRYPVHTIMNGVWLPVVRAASELRAGQPESAIDTLRSVEKYEAGAFFLPQYLRGEAYLRAIQGREAEIEFRKILEHRGQDILSPLYPLGQLGMAQAADLKQDVKQRRRFAGEFLAEWRNADSDLTALGLAKRLVQ